MTRLAVDIRSGIKQQRNAPRRRHRRSDRRPIDSLDASQHQKGRCSGCAGAAGRQHGIAYAVLYQSGGNHDGSILFTTDGRPRMLPHFNDLTGMMYGYLQILPALFFF